MQRNVKMHLKLESKRNLHPRKNLQRKNAILVTKWATWSVTAPRKELTKLRKNPSAITANKWATSLNCALNLKKRDLQEKREKKNLKKTINLKR